MSNWYIIYHGQQIGPMTKENIKAYNPTGETKVWREGMIDWQPIYTIPELMELIHGMPPTHAVYPRQGSVPPATPVPMAGSDKDKTTAGILALLLGSLGIQYFYLGKTGGGLICILLTLITCGGWSLLTFIQGILMLTMTQYDFERKFVYTDKTFPLF